MSSEMAKSIGEYTAHIAKFLIEEYMKENERLQKENEELRKENEELRKLKQCPSSK